MTASAKLLLNNFHIFEETYLDFCYFKNRHKDVLGTFLWRMQNNKIPWKNMCGLEEIWVLYPNGVYRNISIESRPNSVSYAVHSTYKVVFTIHNHPNGDPHPSDADLKNSVEQLNALHATITPGGQVWFYFRGMVLGPRTWDFDQVKLYRL